MLNSENIDAAAVAVAAASDPRTDHRGSADYKRHIVETFVKRVLVSVANSEKKEAVA
jgi:carbon-monoxide dehydrogenase medium subunit